MTIEEDPMYQLICHMHKAGHYNPTVSFCIRGVDDERIWLTLFSGDKIISQYAGISTVECLELALKGFHSGDPLVLQRRQIAEHIRGEAAVTSSTPSETLLLLAKEIEDGEFG